MNAGEQVRVARLARGLSQQRLAELAGVSVRTVRSMERGRHSRPHRESLVRIARAFGFSPIQTERFVTAWQSSPSAARMSPVVGASLDVDAYLGAGGRPLNHGTRITTSTNHMVIGPNRVSTHLTQEFLLEARADPVDHHWLLWGDDDGLDLDSISAVVTVGGTAPGLLLLPGLDVVALRVGLDPALHPGEIRRVGVRWSFHPASTPGPPGVPEFAVGWRDVPHVASIAVAFAHDRPKTAWVVSGANPAHLRVEGPAVLDPTGAATVTRSVDTPGMLGVRWDWG